MSKPKTFIDRHDLWSDEDRRLAADIKRRVKAEKLRYVRLAWSDTHGYCRAKTLTVPAFLSALSAGYNIGVATTTLDGAGARVFASFTRGGGMGLPEMTGSPNLTVVADPRTFRVLPWAPGTGWICATNISTTGGRFISRRDSCCARRCSNCIAAATPASSARKSNGIFCASRRIISPTTISVHRACAGGRSPPGRRSPATTITPSPTWT